MAAVPTRELPQFLVHWRTNILASPTSKARVIVHDGRVAGSIVSWNPGSQRLLGYWVGREFWGKGLATAAVAEFLKEVDLTRPLDASVATHNVGSLRVLQKNGFVIVEGSRVIGEDGIEEVLCRLT